jgi:23S rRNA (cytidine1920-2'-O)/16S rRNA (cytidine1409-2'-O)-methyltransferase
MSKTPPANPQTPRGKQRLDLLLVARGLAESREQAQRLIMAGEVLVEEQVSDKPGRAVPVDAAIRVRRPLPYVSRGGQKLAAALDAFGLDVTGLTAVDVGASTGGFTDCLLQRGAAKVYAIDVGYGQLAWKLRSDPRVVALERTNIRYLEALPDGVLADLAVIDASFISLALVLPPTLRLLTPVGQVVALIKPQFEAGKDDVGKGGVVRDARVHRRVLEETVALAHELGLSVAGLIPSPLLGPAGNVEFLIHLRRAYNELVAPVVFIVEALHAARSIR